MACTINCCDEDLFSFPVKKIMISAYHIFREKEHEGVPESIFYISYIGLDRSLYPAGIGNAVKHILVVTLQLPVLVKEILLRFFPVGDVMPYPHQCIRRTFGSVPEYPSVRAGSGLQQTLIRKRFQQGLLTKLLQSQRFNACTLCCIGAGEIPPALSHQLLRLETEDPLYRRTDIFYFSVMVDNNDQA